MDLAGILIGTIAVGGLIAVLTGLALLGALLRIASGGGLARAPELPAGGVLERERQVRARLRARYMSRWQPHTTAWPLPPDVPEPAWPPDLQLQPTPAGQLPGAVATDPLVPPVAA